MMHSMHEENSQIVNLLYFKSSGEYYSEGSYTSNKQKLYEIWEEVAEMQKKGELPGLVSGAKKPLILVDVPTHPTNCPYLVVNMDCET